MHELFSLLVNYFISFGYVGILVLMAIESSVVPLPSEIIMIPAGYFVFAGKFNFTACILAGAIGSVLGALFNYYMAAKLGRSFIVKYGKYVFLKPRKFITSSKFFYKHSKLATFTGRLLPVVRHYISLPAGLVKMPLESFCFYTFCGAFIWCYILTVFGVWVGNNQDAIIEFGTRNKLVLLTTLAVCLGLFVVTRLFKGVIIKQAFR